MNKNNTLKLDEKDRHILLELETDARQSSAQIARKTRLSEEVVNYRIRKYLKSGIITKFFAIPVFDKLGFTTYRIYLRFRAAPPAKEKEVVDYIIEKMPCQWLGVCDGRWDVIARISARSLFEFNGMMDRFFEKYGSFISAKEITAQLRHTWWPSTYGLAKTPKAKTPRHEVPHNVEQIKYDETDLKIVGILLDEARLPTVEIAKRVGVSPDTVNYRLRRLIKEGVIIQLKSYFNREKLGYQHNQVFMRHSPEPKRVQALISHLNILPECFFISSMVGAWDMQIGIDAKNSVEFHEIWGGIKESFSDVIIDYEPLIVYKEYAPNALNYYIGKALLSGKK